MGGNTSFWAFRVLCPGLAIAYELSTFGIILLDRTIFGIL